jgi:hypothetical protein
MKKSWPPAAVIKLFLSLLAIYGTARACHHATQGFSLSKIEGNLSSQNLDETDLPPPGMKQKFYFLGKGKQSFAFVSEDGQTVLKLFNNRYAKKIELFSHLSHFPLIKNWAEERLHYFKSKRVKTEESYSLALDQMQEQTAILYLHLHLTQNLPRELILVDPLNISHSIDPNTVGFLLQKKATLVYPALKHYVATKDREGAQEAIASLVKLFFWKREHAIADNDPLIRANYGFRGTTAIQIDVGPLSIRGQKQDIKEFSTEVRKITSGLREWLAQNAPELTATLDKELEYQLSCIE